ncbi:hypothetical protein IL306_010429 [Fusarium sp. DS 682]|nr:hypothetical protein IL306_010429 [Fusarium sp. DS 682]
MNAIVDAANAKVKALWAPIMQWSSELNIIKSPEQVYMQKCEVLRARFDNELHQLMHHQNGPNEYHMRSEALLKHAGELKELEIQFKQSVTLMERDFEERLEVAHKRLACGMIEAFGDTIFDPCVQRAFSQRLAHQNSAVETITAQGQHTESPKRDTDLEANPEATVERCIDSDKDQTRPHPAQDNSTLEEQMLEQVPASTEARVLVPAETYDQQQGMAQPITPISASTPTQKTETVSKSRRAVKEAEDTGSQMTQVPTPGPSTEESQTSETIVALGLKPTEKTKSTPGRTEHGAALRASADEYRATPLNESGGNGNSASLDSILSPPNSLVVHLRAPLKRLQTTTSDQLQKRPRFSPKSPNAAEERVIHFDQVFQNGNAQIKYIITQWPPEFGHWYILECKEHSKHFNRHPVIDAANHLAGPEHGLSKEHSLAIKMLGTRVLNCNGKLASQNNKIAMQVFAQGLRLPPQTMAQETRDLLPKGDLAQCYEVVPVVGRIYATSYPRLNHTYPILVMSWATFDHFSWREKLLNNTPSCYVFQKKVDRYPRGWAKDYEDGGSLFKYRKYPVIYFDERNFPDQCNVGWVPISSFKLYDPKNTNVVHSSLVDRFLRYGDPRLTVNRRCSPNRCIVISDDSDGEDTKVEGPVKREDDGMVDNASHGNHSKHMKTEGRGKGRACETKSGNRTHEKPQQSTQVEPSNWNNDTGSSYTSAFPGNTAEISHPNPHRNSQPAYTAAMERRTQAPFVSGVSEEKRQPNPKPQVHPSNSLFHQSAVESGELHGDTIYLNRPPPQTSHAQDSISSMLPQDEDFATTLAAEARAAMLAVEKSSVTDQ